jgi:hypothetical protein
MAGPACRRNPSDCGKSCRIGSVRAILPGSWPPAIGTADAVGYLTARHVPVAFLPQGMGSSVRRPDGHRPAAAPRTPGA